MENEQLLRNPTNYDCDVQSLSHGVKELCVFNKLTHYHNTINTSVDIMHDFHLGICRVDMAKIIEHCIKEKYFTLAHVNDWLKYFDHSDIDHGNKISFISAGHIQKGCIIITAAQMSTLVSYFGILVGDLIPSEDPMWTLYLTLFDILDIVTSTTISESDIIHLEQLIKNHNELFRKSLMEPLKAKAHIANHYPNLIKKMGPLIYLSTAKYEAFHQISKKSARLAAEYKLQSC